MAATPLGDAAVTSARRDVCDAIAAVVADADVQRPVLVAVDGRDGAGKTRFADDLADHLRDDGRHVQRVELDRFLQSRKRRHARGRWSPVGFFHDSTDLDAVQRWVLGPLGVGLRARANVGVRGHATAHADVQPHGDADTDVQPHGDGDTDAQPDAGTDAQPDADAPTTSDERHIRTGVYDLGTERPRLDPPVAVPDDAVVVVDGLFLHGRRLRGSWDVSVFLQVDPAVSFARVANRDGNDPDPDAPANRRCRDGMRLYLEECDPASLATFVIDNRDVDAPVVLSGPGT